MIIWSGLGYLAAAITFGACLLAQLVFDARFGDGFYSSHPWAVGLGLLVGGVISSLVGFVLKARKDREVVDPQTGQRLVINLSQHSFFFVPMHWAGIAIALIGLIIALKDAIT